LTISSYSANLTTLSQFIDEHKRCFYPQVEVKRLNADSSSKYTERVNSFDAVQKTSWQIPLLASGFDFMDIFRDMQNIF